MIFKQPLWFIKSADFQFFGSIASSRFSRDKFVPLQTKQRYSTRDISGEVFLTLFFRGFVPFLSLADFVSRDKNLQVADLQWLKLYFGGLVTATTRKVPHPSHRTNTAQGLKSLFLGIARIGGYQYLCIPKYKR